MRATAGATRFIFPPVRVPRRGAAAFPVVLLAAAAICGGCRAEDEDHGGAPAPAPTSAPAASVPGAGAAGDASSEPAETREEFERRVKSAADAERRREALIAELASLPTARFTTAADVLELVDADDPPRLFRLHEDDLESMSAEARTDAIARYDRISRGLKRLAVLAIEEAASLRDDGRGAEAAAMLGQVRSLAAASSGSEVAEIGRDAARAVVAMMDAALGPPVAGDAGDADG
jgi:hypothetical protein